MLELNIGHFDRKTRDINLSTPNHAETISCAFMCNKHKGKGAGLSSDIKSEDLSSDIYILPLGHWTCSFVCHFNSTESIQSCSRFGALNSSYTLPSLSYQVGRYSFSPESSEAFEGEVPCPRTQHLNNVPRLRVEKNDISLKILHQAGFETARQAATLAERHALTIAPCPFLI